MSEQPSGSKPAEGERFYEES
eukprot:COSAG06_NODE_43972_length_367_cov_0.929104_1_plen_20_part_10